MADWSGDCLGTLMPAGALSRCKREWDRMLSFHYDGKIGGADIGQDIYKRTEAVVQIPVR